MLRWTSLHYVNLLNFAEKWTIEHRQRRQSLFNWRLPRQIYFDENGVDIQIKLRLQQHRNSQEQCSPPEQKVMVRTGHHLLYGYVKQVSQLPGREIEWNYSMEMIYM